MESFYCLLGGESSSSRWDWKPVFGKKWRNRVQLWEIQLHVTPTEGISRKQGTGHQTRSPTSPRVCFWARCETITLVSIGINTNQELLFISDLRHGQEFLINKFCIIDLQTLKYFEVSQEPFATAKKQNKQMSHCAFTFETSLLLEHRIRSGFWKCCVIFCTCLSTKIVYYFHFILN